MANPNYHNLGDHTETVVLEYDATVTSYLELLKMFWANHDPTVCHKRQYMSAIFYHNEEQKRLATESMAETQKGRAKPLATRILPAEVFYDAELYHQKYMLQNNPAFVKCLGLKGDELVKSHTAARLNGYLGGFGSLAAFEGEQGKLGLSEEQAAYVRKQMHRGNRAAC